MYAWVRGYPDTCEILYTEFRVLNLWLFLFHYFLLYSVATVIMLGPDPAFSVRKDSTLSIGTSATLNYIVTVACPQVKAAKKCILTSDTPVLQVWITFSKCPAFFLSSELSVSCFFVFSLELIAGLLGLMLSY